MIKLEIYWYNGPYPKAKYVYVDEETLDVNHYDEDIPSERLNQTITLIQKAINNICGMPFRFFPFNSSRHATGESDYAYIDVNRDSIDIVPRDSNCLIDCVYISYNDFKKLLIAQHKENELSYLLLKGVCI